MTRGGPSLADYRSKRDFTRTAEPSGIGANTVRTSPHLRFVVQKHAARRLHYDLRLELGDTFKSWAVTNGPSLDPAQKRLAVEVEDHPLEYGDFEGTIPAGEYGGGTVMIWDRGFWAPESTSPLQALRDGELKFTLAGEKLKGGFVLIRMKRRKGDSRDNWLLIKHRDDWATPGIDGVLDKQNSVASGRTLARIAAGTGHAAIPFMTKGANISSAATWDEAAAAKAQSSAARRRSAAGPSLDVHMPRLTHPERELWPGDRAATKQDLAEYLMSVAAWMMPHVYGRPCSLLRAPDGIEGELFFQRHPMKGQPPELVKVTVDSTHEPYIEIDDASTLVAMAQFSTMEFHPWNSAPFEPLVPGRLVFDLDPGPDVPFDAVVDAAKAVRALVQKVGLVAFCKTTGGKGLHVVVPLTRDDSIDWDQAKLFCQTVAGRIAEDAPDRFVVTMSKRLRKGRIFIDYLRNDLTATAVAPLSPRARPGATVSMPLTWRQVRHGLDPARFTIRTAPKLLASSKPWADYDASARPLRRAIEALVGSVA